MLKYFMIVCAVVLYASGTQQIFYPCPGKEFYMSREIGHPDEYNNLWKGYFDFTKYGLRELALQMRLTAPATVTYVNADAVIAIIPGDKETIYSLQFPFITGGFTVAGPPRSECIQLAELYINNINICPNPKPWPCDGSNVDINSDSKCGRRIVQHEKLITNGFLTQEGQWPWHAGIFLISSRSKASSYNCGGTLISSKFVIAAGHCVIESSKVMTPERILVRLGQHNLLFVDANTQEFHLFDIILHEKYSAANFGNDIALLKLATDVQYTDYIQPACLWERTTVDLSSVVGKLGYRIGWGYNEEGAFSDVLMQAEMQVVSFHTCLDSHDSFLSYYLSPLKFCAGYRNGTGACNGNSGGGIFFEKDNTYWLRGIVSLIPVRPHTNRCALGQYALFTDVAQYIDWIESHLNE